MFLLRAVHLQVSQIQASQPHWLLGFFQLYEHFGESMFWLSSTTKNKNKQDPYVLPSVQKAKRKGAERVPNRQIKESYNETYVEL